MADVSTLDQFLVTIKSRLNNQTVLSTLGYYVDAVVGSVTVGDAQTQLALALGGAGNIVPKMLPCIPQNQVVEEIWTQKIRPTRFAKYVLDAGDLTGSSGYIALAPNAASVITKRGELSGRSFVGELHLPFAVNSDSAEDGTISGPMRTALSTLATQMVQSISVLAGSLVFRPCILHRNPLAGLTPVVQCVPQDTVRVMRRRTVGLGI